MSIWVLVPKLMHKNRFKRSMALPGSCSIVVNYANIIIFLKNLAFKEPKWDTVSTAYIMHGWCSETQGQPCTNSFYVMFILSAYFFSARCLSNSKRFSLGMCHWLYIDFFFFFKLKVIQLLGSTCVHSLQRVNWQQNTRNFPQTTYRPTIPNENDTMP